MKGKCIDEDYFAPNVKLGIPRLRLFYMMIVQSIGLMVGNKISHKAESIVEDIAQLVPYTMVAEAHQINRSTLYDWINKGFSDIQAGKTSTEWAKFYDAIKKRQCVAVKELLNEIKKGEKGWQARAWILERRFPLDFSSCAQELLQMKEQIDHIEALLKPNV
ncbi:hypothetical protein FQR65_LT19211 [Abscondita terminalis]|nr:hypothetical protein FQR65_LT19211 [Abscondita terminalis]